jgi:lysophospholipase
VAFASSPTNSYVPGRVDCPSFDLIRPASSGLSANETNWLKLRRPNVVNALESWLPRAIANVGNSTFNVTAYIAALRANDSLIPVAGLALSGGGARAEYSGYGAWQALDERYPPALAAGSGGIVQALTYLAGLSGGSGPTGALGFGNFSTVAEIMSWGNDQFNLTYSPLSSTDEDTVRAALTTDLDGIVRKAQAGFNVTTSDLLGYALGQQTIYNQSTGVSVPVESRTWSDVQGYAAFSQGLYPMPIQMVNEVVPPGIPNVTEFFGILVPQHNSSNNTIVQHPCYIPLTCSTRSLPLNMVRGWDELQLLPPPNLRDLES